MKTKENVYKKFLELFIQEVPAKKIYHGKDPQLDKLINPQNGETIKRLNTKTLGTLLLTPAIIAGGLSYAKNSNEQHITKPPAILNQQQTNINPLPFDNNLYTANYNGIQYVFLKEEYVLSLATNSLARVQTMLSGVDGITPVGTNNGEFYPDYFNPYLLTALCHTESSYRISNIDGNLLSSQSGALGLTQIKPSTIENLNYWLHNTMNLKGVSYSVDDLKNPETAMDITTLILIQICKNHGKVGCNNPIYTNLNESFSLKRQEEIILAVYNNGYENIKNYIANGIIYNYLKEGAPSNYVNKLLSKKQQLEERYEDMYK